MFQVVSSRWTMLLKLILPTIWVCFFGGMAVVIPFLDLPVGEPFSPLTAKLTIIGFSLSSIGLLYLLFMRIKWVALDTTHIYVSNFFKSYKYTYESISNIQTSKILWSERITIQFHEPTAFGSSIFFISSPYWAYFFEKNPQVMDILTAKP